MKGTRCNSCQNVIYEMVILSDSELREMIAYRFVILLGICDVVEASLHCMTGVALLFPNFWSTQLDNVSATSLI
ncbi:hypothetical protein ANCCAN_29488 [Ancylostoma caninum]|uniref:Uncharacterized protein n=1 Tax=Ancylostoma caninum TaxID=29170 RepID=A0A368F1A3_ANCCA|nr:hypothetical protein ANCCAN_29488 [Ancylostoma caninum]